MSPRESVGLIWAAIKTSKAGGWHQIAGLAAIAVLLGIVPVTSAWLMRYIIDGIHRGRPLWSLMTLAGGLAVAGAAAAILVEVQRYLNLEFGRGLSIDIRGSLYRAVNRFPGIGMLEDPHFQDRLRLAVQGGHTGPSQVVASVLGVAQAAVTFAGFVGTLFLLNPWMLAVMAVAALPSLRAELALGSQRAQLMTRLTHAARREFFYAELITGVTAAKEVRLLGLGDFFGRRMLGELTTINRRNRAMDLREMRIHMLLAASAALVSAAGLVWAISAAANGALSIGDIAVFVAAVAGGQSSLATMMGYLGRANHSLLLFAHYRAVVNAEADLPLPVMPQPAPALTTAIEFEDVWFRYDEAHPWILQGLDLTLAAGQSTAIVGINGAGKSTIVKLLCRFYDPAKGRILWDGHDIRTFSPQELRDRIGAVFQDFVSYELTARENVGLGDIRALDDERSIRHAMEQAGSTHYVAALPRGLDTMLTRTFLSTEEKNDPEVGVVLSGGQWQRLALARALMRAERDLLILDEPSSGLDADAEHDIHLRLQQLRGGKTSLLISHRLNTLRDADAIAVLGDGRIVEYGRHDELIARDGVYARLFHKQSKGYQDDDTSDR